VKETSRLTYLGSNSIENVTHSDNKGWIAFNAPASMVEGLLHTEFHEHHDLESGNVVPSCDQYHVPRYMQHHIDFITPGIKLIGKATAEFSGTATEMHKRHGHWQPKPPLRSHRHPFPHPWPTQTLAYATKRSHRPVFKLCISFHQVSKPCGNETQVHDCSMLIYSNRKANSAHPDNSMGIYESLLEFWNQQDLDSFFTSLYPVIPNGTHPIDNGIDGGVATTSSPVNDGGEMMLDIQLAYPIVYPQTVTIWDEDDLNYQGEANVTYNGGFNTLLDAIDGSYYTYSAYGETGDDTKDQLDPVYPDTLPGGYKGKLQCGVSSPPP
jgi:tripeptidyl-peptidase-1